MEICSLRGENLQMKMWALKTASTRRVEFLSRSTATWQQSSVQKKERLDQSQATKEELPKRGFTCEEVSEYFWHSEGWTSRHEALLEAVVKQVRATRHPWLIACDANMRPEDFETKGSVDVQIKTPKV